MKNKLYYLKLIITILVTSLIFNSPNYTAKNSSKSTIAAENNERSVILLAQSRQQWRSMTNAEKAKEIESLIDSSMGIAALNQLALEGFIGFGCNRRFYVNEQFGGAQTLMQVKCNQPKGTSTAIQYNEIRVIFNRFEGNIENFEIERVSPETGPPKIRLPE